MPTPVTYRIKPGDSLSGIAVRVHRTLGQLLTANPEITDPNHIEAGQLIVIPDANAPDIPPSLASVEDVQADLVDESGFEVTGQSYADFLGFAARLRDTDLLMEMQLLSGPPSVDPSVETVTYTINIDTNDDGEPDFAVTYGNAVGDQPGYAASLRNLGTGEELVGFFFPGTVEEQGDNIRIAVSLAAIGDTGGYALAAGVKRSFFPGGATDPQVETSVDLAPDEQWPSPNARWIRVGD
ncbi:MAG: hypothetical protein QOH61_2843 [Chloroflexota bacterium]|nr:hypothetical protein [Chloroflexota bacterium]